MKRIISKIFKLFRFIGDFIDKIVITPITKLILKIIHYFKDNSKSIDRFIGKKSTLIVISLFLAIGVYIIINKEATFMIDQYAEILYNQPVEAVYNDELYVVEGLPKTIDITLIGQKRHIFLAKQSPSKGATVDLTGLKPGTHKVDLKYSQRLKSLDYKLDPSQVTVTIYEKVSETRSLSYDILHQDSLDSKLSIDSIELDRTDIIIKGAEYKLAKVASVKALIDCNEINNNSDAKKILSENSDDTKSINLDNVSLVAYDANGKVVNVEIVPTSVNATVTLSSPNKEVPIVVVPTGSLAFGKAIKSIDASLSSVRIYGDKSSIDKVNNVEATIDVNGLDKDRVFNVTLKKPSGITELNNSKMTVKVTIGNSITKEFDNVQISTENLDSKYKVQALSEADSKVTVIVEGCDDVISDVDLSSIKAYVDLKDYGVGEHKVAVKVLGDDLRLTYKSKTKEVKVKISEK